MFSGILDNLERQVDHDFKMIVLRRVIWSQSPWNAYRSLWKNALESRRSLHLFDLWQIFYWRDSLLETQENWSQRSNERSIQALTSQI